MDQVNRMCIIIVTRSQSLLKTCRLIVTVQAKTSLAHTSDFANLMAYKECYTMLKFSAMIKLKN